jgi:pimeloyl-ACP methyl ester carboxylesterase
MTLIAGGGSVTGRQIGTRIYGKVSYIPPQMSIRTTVVETPDGRELCVESAGDPSGPTVLVHDGTPNSRHLEAKAIRDAEQRGIHLLSYDRPGYGGSTARPGSAISDCTTDVQAIAEAFGIARLATWGISGGGPYALACAALLPDLVTSAATLASIAPYGVPDLDYFSGMGQENVDDNRLLLENPEAARTRIEELRDEALAMTPEQLVDAWSSLLSPTDARAATGEMAAHIVHCMQEGLAPGVQGWWDESLAHLAPWGFSVEDIGIPMQVWHGEEDQFVPFQHGQWLLAHIPGAEAHLSSDDGHLTLTRQLPHIHDWLIAHS